MKIWMKTSLGSSRRILKNLVLMGAGSLVCAAAINGILIEHQFLSGGLTGLALFAHYMVPALPVDVLYLVANIPLFLLGYRRVNRRFFFYSLIGTLMFSLAVRFIHIHIPAGDMLASAVLTGIMMGLGGGLILKSQGSAGGLDILAVFMMRSFSLRLGSTYLAFNTLVLATGVLFFPLDTVIYTLIFMFVTSKCVDLVITGFSQRKAIMVVTRHWERMRGELLRKTKGATVLDAVGAFSGRSTKMIYTVVSQNELGRTKEMVRQLDPEAFVVVTDTLEVVNPRIGNQPHW